MSIDDSSIDRFTASSGVATTWCQSYWFRISDLIPDTRAQTRQRRSLTGIAGVCRCACVCHQSVTNMPSKPISSRSSSVR